ncbi:unnamed protein product [Ectocarpus sp. CCAP 1310/34]|nr:unnamed protein product [Ectocarpus sp. CCAP 1310/34]
MKFSTVAASLCVLGSASAFVLPVPARSGVATRMSASLDEAAAEKAKAREALIGSAGMEQLIKMVAQDDGEDEEVPPAKAAPPTPASPPAEK